VPPDILGGQVGGSVKRLSEVFARARENSPSIVLFDEIDGVMPRNNGTQSTPQGSAGRGPDDQR
jgi:SpoVK/Ycf46/Vps4 family AAA+-type ATPase